MDLPLDILSQAATIARGLAMDAVHNCNSGHLGLPLGCAEIGAVLFGHDLAHNPDDPRWLDRDRFVLSAGHGSMFLYGWLHLAGYPRMTLDELKNFRQLGSHTPGHPEQFETPGVEATTGPLGQGIGNAVGFAVSQKIAAARFNTEKHRIFDNHVICLAGDGCMQERVSHEVCAFAAHFKLDDLILLFAGEPAQEDQHEIVEHRNEEGLRPLASSPQAHALFSCSLFSNSSKVFSRSQRSRWSRATTPGGQLHVGGRILVDGTGLRITGGELAIGEPLAAPFARNCGGQWSEEAVLDGVWY